MEAQPLRPVGSSASAALSSFRSRLGARRVALFRLRATLHRRLRSRKSPAHLPTRTSPGRPSLHSHLFPSDLCFPRRAGQLAELAHRLPSCCRKAHRRTLSRRLARPPPHDPNSSFPPHHLPPHPP